MALDPKAIGPISEGKQVRQWLVAQEVGLLGPAVVDALRISRSLLEVCRQSLGGWAPYRATPRPLAPALHAGLESARRCTALLLDRR
jgi:hypothetical protein